MKKLLYFTLFCTTLLFAACENNEPNQPPVDSPSTPETPVSPDEPTNPNCPNNPNDPDKPNNQEPITRQEVFVAMPFSVSATQQVEFSSGNLQYIPADNKWRFAFSQLDYIGNDNVNISSTYSGWIDLFGNGTGAAPTNVSMDYQNDYNNLVDWGVNKIGPDAPYTWRSLTNEEWYYLLAMRPNANQLIGIAQICGVNGLVLLPDEWVCPEGLVFKAGGYESSEKIEYASYQSFNDSQWFDLAESGAVFLPAAGNRAGTSVNFAGQLGIYWSFYDDGYTGTSKEYLHIEAGNVSIGIAPRNLGASVRLVKEI